MRLIHCADLHLDSHLSAHLAGRKRKERQNELLTNFERLCEYAVSADVKAILISGDLYDHDQVSETAANMVLDVIRAHENIEFYYLRGNHDTQNVFSDDNVPANLFLFSDSWITYDVGEGIRIHGLEWTAANARTAAESLKIDPRAYNIVMLHGQAAESVESSSENISLPRFRHHNIDYLALGHLHEYRKEGLDGRGVYVYPGCLEGRGFDECGEKGFVLLDVDPALGQASYTLVPFARRKLYRISADITGCMTTGEALRIVREELEKSGAEEQDLLKIVLSGNVDAEAEKDLSYMETALSDSYYYVTMADETVCRVDEQAYRYDKTLRGTFIQQVLADENLSEEDKGLVIRYGLQALKQEEFK